MTGGYLSELFVSFQGEGVEAGRRHLFLRLGGCPLRCRYCDTPESLERQERFSVEGRGSFANPVSAGFVAELVAELLGRRGPTDGSAITGGEPLVQPAFLEAVLASGCLPRPVLLETAGTHPGNLARIAGAVDRVSMDLKLPSCSGEAPLWEAHARCLALCRGKVVVKIPIAAAIDWGELRKGLELVAACDASIPVFLQPVMNPDGTIDPRVEQLEEGYRLARTVVEDVRVTIQQHKVIGIR